MATSARTTDSVPGRSPIWIDRHTANDDSSLIRDLARTPGVSSTDGSCMVPTTKATTAPAITDITRVCNVRALPDAATTSQHAERPDGERAVVRRELPEFAAGDEDASHRLLEHPRHRGEPEQHGGVAVDSVDERGEADRHDGDDADRHPLRLEEGPAISGVEPIEHGERVADPPALDRVDGGQDAEEQAERTEAGGTERPQCDQRQDQG